MEIELVDIKNLKSLGKHKFNTTTTKIKDIKLKVHQLTKILNPDRQSIRVDPKGKSLKDSDTLDRVKIQNGKLFVKDLGTQIGWTTVFLCEYAGPLIIYLLIYQFRGLYYGSGIDRPRSTAAKFAAACWTIHYLKRILETIFVHRFSHSTMPIRNLFKNCAFYWGFSAYVSYHINHPLFTEPWLCQTYIGLMLFAICELGNFSSHIVLRNLRPPGTTIRRIPQPNSWNPLTKLFNFVSCANYTYEFGSWIAFTVMTQCLPALLFTLAGLYQMGVWALAKQRIYRKEFKDYPLQRKAILPFLL